MQIFAFASSLHNSSELLQAIASIYYSSGEVAKAYYSLESAALEEGEKIARVQFWQMYNAFPFLLQCFATDFSPGMVAQR
jgi:hypothetical protein